MRRATTIPQLCAVLVLMAAPGWAADGGVRHYPAGGSGGAFTAPLLGPAFDDCAAPPYSFTGDTTTGLCSSADGMVHLRSNGVNVVTADGTGAQLGATLGAELAPAITAANWTCGAGWDCSVAGTLNKNAGGVGTAAPTAAIVAVVGTTYRVSITVGALTVASGATYTFGGTAGSAALSAAGTYTQYVTAATTASLIITPTPTATRFTITAVSVKALTNATGDLEVQGNLTVRSPATFDSPVYLPDGSTTPPALTFAGNATMGIRRGGGNLLFQYDQTRFLTLYSSEFYPTPTDAFALGDASLLWTTAYLSRSIQGGKSQALTDAAAATASVTVAVPTNGRVSGELLWEADSVSGADQLVANGSIRWWGADTAGTPVCGINKIGTDGEGHSGGANTLVCTWTNVVSTTNCALSVTCTNDLAGVQAITLYRRFTTPITVAATFQ